MSDSGSGIFNNFEALPLATRKTSHVLIVDHEREIRLSIRKALTDLGYGGIGEAPDHAAGVQRFQERMFTHVIFSAVPTNMSPKHFLTSILEMDDTIVGIPSSYEPTVDDVFTLLMEGAQGYLVKPLTVDSLEEAIAIASMGEPIPDAILYAKDRNEALANLTMTALDRMAILTRQSGEFGTAKIELPKVQTFFKKSILIGKTFAKGGDEGIRDAFIELALKRADGPATSLGRLRKRRQKRKEMFSERKKVIEEKLAQEALELEASELEEALKQAAEEASQEAENMAEA